MRHLNLLLAFVILSNVTNSQILKSDRIFSYPEPWDQWTNDFNLNQPNEEMMPDDLYSIPKSPKDIVKPLQPEARSDVERDRPGQYLRNHMFLDSKVIPGPDPLTGKMRAKVDQAEIKQKLDSTIRESYQEWIGGWIVEYNRRYIRNDSNRITEYKIERINPETNEMFTQSKYEYTYDTDQTTRLSYINYLWDNEKAELLPKEKRLYEYGDGSVLTSTIYLWNINTGLWDLSRKEELLIEGILLQTVIVYAWDTIAVDWVSDSKRDYLYDEAGNGLEEKIMIWDQDKSTWVNSSKQEYTYADFKIRTLNQTSIWDTTASDWLIATKIAYNDDGLELEYSRYNWTESFSDIWIDYQRLTEYNDSNLLVNKSYSSWNPDFMKLITTSKYENSYNENIQLTEALYFRWYPDSMKLLPYTKNESLYDEKQQNTRTNSFRWDILASKWDTTARSDHFYDETGLRASTINYTWSGSFYENNRQEYSYDEEERLVMTIGYGWNGYGWFENTKQELTFDEAGRIVKTTDFQWNGYEWTSIRKQEEIWDGNNYLGRQEARWDPELGGWTKRIDKFLYTEEGFLSQEDYIRYALDLSVDYRYRDMYSYNEQGELDTIYYSYTDEITGELIVDEIISLEYNELDQITGYKGSEWDSQKKEFVTEWKGEIEYNGAGDYVRWTDYYWNEDKKIWIGDDQELMNYDVNGLLIQELDQDWDTILGWVDYYKSDYTYDENGNQLTKKFYQWSKESAVWIPNEFQEYTYDMKNQMVMRKNYWWYQEDNLWFAGDSSIYKYDMNGNNTLREDYYWNPDESVWVPSQKYIYGYDTDGNNTLREYYSWDYFESIWSPYSKYVFAYDTHGNLLSDQYFSYDYSQKNYVDRRKTIYSYDLTYKIDEVLIPWDRGGESYIALDGGWDESDYLKEGMILSIVESEKDYDSEKYREVNRETFYYSGAQIFLADVQPFAPEIKVYPNPASNTVYFSLGNETLSRAEIRIIDLSGKTMIIKILDHEGSMDISSLNNGLYLIQIKTGEKLFTRKFIKSTY